MTRQRTTDPQVILRRLLAKVERRDGHWIWTGATAKGYGMAWSGQTTEAGHYLPEGAHRAMYRMLVGEIPAGMQIDHLCRTPLCVNPAHLEPVTPRENVRRIFAGVRECKNGHPFDEANTYFRPSGRRSCRACNRENARRTYLRRRSVEEIAA